MSVDSVVTFLYEMGHLKRTARAGWLLAGIDNPESVAEHSFRAALIAYVLALMENADPTKTATLALFHDTQETRLGDLPSVGRPYVTTVSEEEVVRDQVAGMPETIGEPIRDLVTEYEACETVEARLAREADRIECLLQAREYTAQGRPGLDPWVITSAAAVRSASGRSLAEAARRLTPHDWWSHFASGFKTRRRTESKEPNGPDRM